MPINLPEAGGWALEQGGGGTCKPSPWAQVKAAGGEGALHKPGSKGWGKTNVISQLSIPSTKRPSIQPRGKQGSLPRLLAHTHQVPSRPPPSPESWSHPASSSLLRGRLWGPRSCPFPVRPGAEPGHLPSSRVTVTGWGACHGVGVGARPSPAHPRPDPPATGRPPRGFPRARQPPDHRQAKTWPGPASRWGN